MFDLARAIDDVTPQGIASEIGRRITAGDLGPDERLPTVRELAAALGVSPATVSHAWQALSSAGLIVSRGRSGSFVRSTNASWLPRRMAQLAGHVGPAGLDLSRGTPDPELLPLLGPALGRVPVHADTDSYQALPVIPELHRLLRESWPFPAESLTIVDGALDGISRTLEQVVRFGDRVAVESPGFPPVFDLLDTFGVERVALEIDTNGVTPRSMLRALARGVSALVIQPRAHNPTGVSMTPQRAEELALIIAGHRRGSSVVVIEDDHSGQIAEAPDVSLGRWLPGQVVHVRSFSKSHGPDLRIAALGGPRPLVDRIVARRVLGPGWTSRMLQAILHDLLTNWASVAHVANAREVYAGRQRALRNALAALGVHTPRADGINIWLPVADERDAVVRLAAAGIRVATGAPFYATPEESSGAIRVTVGSLTGDAAPVAAALADVIAR